MLWAHVFGSPDQHPRLAEQRLFRKGLFRRLGQPEIDDLRHRHAVTLHDEDVGWLQIAVDHALLVRVLHRIRHLEEQFQTAPHVQPLTVAVVGDGNPRHVLHGEIRPSLRARTCLVHLGDIGMIHQGQGLLFALKARQDGARVHAELDQLERHLADHRQFLFGEVHHPHAAFAQKPHDAICPDPPPRLQEIFRRVRRRMAQGGDEQASGAQILFRAGFQAASTLRATLIDVHYSAPRPGFRAAPPFVWRLRMPLPRRHTCPRRLRAALRPPVTGRHPNSPR